MARALQGKQYLRVVDMFTPNRGMQLADSKLCKGGFCGTDDIKNAIGVSLRMLQSQIAFLALCSFFPFPDPFQICLCLWHSAMHL